VKDFSTIAIPLDLILKSLLMKTQMQVKMTMILHLLVKELDIVSNILIVILHDNSMRASYIKFGLILISFA